MTRPRGARPWERGPQLRRARPNHVHESEATTEATIAGPIGDPLGLCVSYLAQRAPDQSSARHEIRTQWTVVNQAEPSALGRPSEGTRLFSKS